MSNITENSIELLLKKAILAKGTFKGAIIEYKAHVANHMERLSSDFKTQKQIANFMKKKAEEVPALVKKLEDEIGHSSWINFFQKLWIYVSELAAGFVLLLATDGVDWAGVYGAISHIVTDFPNMVDIIWTLFDHKIKIEELDLNNIENAIIDPNDSFVNSLERARNLSNSFATTFEDFQYTLHKKLNRINGHEKAIYDIKKAVDSLVFRGKDLVHQVCLYYES